MESDQGGDIAAIPTHVKEQATEIGRRSEKHEQQGVVSKSRYYRVPFLVLEDRRVEGPMKCRAAQRFRFSNERRHPSREIFIVESRRSKSFYQQTVFPQDQNGVYSRTLSERARKISYVRHCWVKKLRS
jgi:hypothetical protein